MQFTENSYENDLIELFRRLGYEHLYAPDIDRDYYVLFLKINCSKVLPT